MSSLSFKQYIIFGGCQTAMTPRHYHFAIRKFFIVRYMGTDQVLDIV